MEDFPAYINLAKQGRWDRDRLRCVKDGEEWTPVIGRCLEPNQKDRYESVIDVLQDMKSMVGPVEQMMVSERLSRKANISSVVVSQGDNLGERFHLLSLLSGRRRMLHVGREKDNDIILHSTDSSYVSRYHFTLEKSEDGTFWTIRDGQWQKEERRWVTSTNGTYINATPVPLEGIRLFTGDIITAGEYKLKVE